MVTKTGERRIPLGKDTERVMSLVRTPPRVIIKRDTCHHNLPQRHTTWRERYEQSIPQPCCEEREKNQRELRPFGTPTWLPSFGPPKKTHPHTILRRKPLLTRRTRKDSGLLSHCFVLPRLFATTLLFTKDPFIILIMKVFSTLVLFAMTTTNLVSAFLPLQPTTEFSLTTLSSK